MFVRGTGWPSAVSDVRPWCRVLVIELNLEGAEAPSFVVSIADFYVPVLLPELICHELFSLLNQPANYQAGFSSGDVAVVVKSVLDIDFVSKS